MDIPDTKNRNQLKGYFVKNAIPTEGQFADLIEAGVNQRDDGLVKAKGQPLSIEAGGDDTSQKKVLSLFRNASDSEPACVLSLNPFGNPSDASTRVAGLGIGDGAGNTRLYLDPTSGKIGVGTVAPQAALHVAAGAIMPSAGNTAASGIQFPANPGGGGGDGAWIRYYPRVGESTTLEIGASNDVQDHISLMPSGSLGIGTLKPTHKFHVKAGNAVGLFESTGNNAYLRIHNNEGIGNRVELACRAGGRLALWVAGKGDALNITRDGLVGIGTINPQADVHVVGNLLGAARNVAGHAQRIRCGSTTSSAWKKYSSSGVFVDVDTKSAGFSSTPTYVASLAGSTHHWATTGGSSIYNPTKDGFRIYVRWADGKPLTPADAKRTGWHVTWVGIGN